MQEWRTRAVGQNRIGRREGSLGQTERVVVREKKKRKKKKKKKK